MQTFITTIIICILIIDNIILAANYYNDPPVVSSPIIAAFIDKPMEITGSGFGTPSPDHEILIKAGDKKVKISSTSNWIVIWEDSRIVCTLPQKATSGWVQIKTPFGTSSPVKIDVYKYDWFDIPVTPGTNASPLAIAVDPKHRVWVNQEFHLEFQLLDPQIGSVTGLAIPQPVNPGPFASTIFGDHRTQMSTLGEDIIIDPQGRVWFTQGGGYLYSGVNPNHSRIVCYDQDAPVGEQYRVYNIPGDWNEIIGLAWDDVRQRMWFAEGGLEKGGKIVSFDPEVIEYDNDFDFSQSLDYLICQPGEPESECYKVYELPNPKCQPAHMVVDKAGFVWYTGYWGNSIGRLDPETGIVEDYPLPEAIGESDPVPIVGSGPWQILIDPQGNIVFNEFFDSTICRFRIKRINDPACLKLNAAGRNPCIDEIVVPDADLVNEQVHSIAFDAAGNLWYTMHSNNEPGTLESLGYITADMQHAVRLPPLSQYPGTGGAATAGIAIDKSTGDIWFSEFWRKRIGHLRKITAK